MSKTRRKISDAATCRAFGWGPGTLVTGFSPKHAREITIRITAVGETQILARLKGYGEFSSWDLSEWELFVPHGTSRKAVSK